MQTLTLRTRRPASRLESEFDSLFSRVFRDADFYVRPRAGFISPPVESFMRGDEIVIRADLPGVEPKDVELSVEGDRLTIKGERKVVTNGEEPERFYREVGYGSFERSFKLPARIDGDSVKASYHDGVLEVTMAAPKELVAKKVSITVH